MSVISGLLLRAKNWQIFLVFTLACLAGIIVTVSMTTQPPGDLRQIGFPFWVVSGMFELLFLAWFWSMGSSLSSLVDPALRPNVAFFLFALIYPPAYVFAFIALLQKQPPLLFAVVLLLHLLAMFCMFYSLYFVSKSLVLAETGKAASFYDYAGPFFLIWFFPIGVWVVQPRINQLYAEKMPARLPGLKAD